MIGGDGVWVGWFGDFGDVFELFDVDGMHLYVVGLMC